MYNNIYIYITIYIERHLTLPILPIGALIPVVFFLTMETPEQCENSVKDNNEDSRTTPNTSFWCFYS